MPRLECPTCGGKINAGDAEPGDEVACPDCKRRVLVPDVKRTFSNQDDRDRHDDIDDDRYDERRADQPPQVWLIVGLVSDSIFLLIVILSPFVSFRSASSSDVMFVLIVALLLTHIATAAWLSGWVAQDARCRSYPSSTAWSLIVLQCGAFGVFVYLQLRTRGRLTQCRNCRNLLLRWVKHCPHCGE